MRQLNRIYNSGSWPERFRCGELTAFYKKGDRLNPENYRGITLLPILSKILLSILASRLYLRAETIGLLSEEQGGFRKGRSCEEQVFTLHCLLSHRKKNGLNSFVAFLDLRKAYDYVWRRALLVHLTELGIRGKMCRILDASYT